MSALPKMITYVKGDATDPVGDGPKIIAHITNNRGGWGSGFVVALSRRWKMPENVYRLNKLDHVLGCNQYMEVATDLWVANMCAQDGFTSPARVTVVDYEALGVCLKSLARKALAHGLSVHCPRIGCGLGGGDWSQVEQLLNEYVVSNGINVTVYDL